ncbi:general stress protein, partial [Brooklawnia sp.]|uniref:general stress protein n=1 Tax=Brooklawnia sp. TaxID=2699740 RepID=UPI003C780857
MSMNQFPSAQPRGVLKLKRPMSVAIYDEYSDAARAVDYLADRQFPVENLAIVGTDLKSVEKVTGNMTWGKVLFAGFVQGAMWAGMFAIFLWILQPGLSLFTVFMIAILGFGAVGMLMAALQYRMRGGERDYTSTTAIIATHYEVLAEAEVADRARHLLSGGAPHQTRQREMTTSAGLASGQEQQDQQVDLGGMPPPYGQQPSQAAASGQPGWG